MEASTGAQKRAGSSSAPHQLEAAGGEALRCAWSVVALPNRVVDVDSTICEVTEKHKAGAACGDTTVLGLHPLLATRGDTGEVLPARLRRGRPTPNVGRSASSKSS